MNPDLETSTIGNRSSFFDLTGRVALVTGTSRGLGQYFARALGRAGADLILTSRNRDSLRSLKRRLSR